MTSAHHRLGDGLSCPAKGFPAGTSQKREDAGCWLLQAHRKSENRAANRGKKCKTTEADQLTLDALFLLQLHCVDDPSQICSVDISEQKLNSVKPEGFQVFENIAYIDASINSLSLGSFSCFPSLRELNLSLNRIQNLDLDSADFHHLQVLNLSYNSLSPESLISLSGLSSLKVLHLTGNGLHHLPPNLSSSDQDPTEMSSEQERKHFESLEVLILDDNKLSSVVFYSLVNLKRLKHLNLQKNLICEIPCLQMTRGLTPEQISYVEEGKFQSLTLPHVEEHVKILKNIQEVWETSSLPLPELQILNLADNKIVKEEALLGAALFPKLLELDIHSNPLTTKRKGDPPLLTFYLQERRGIRIRGKKPEDASRLSLKASAAPRWKVGQSDMNVSKRPMIIKEMTRGDRKKISCSDPEKTEPFFITQEGDDSNSESNSFSVENEAAKNKRAMKTNNTSYEMMMGLKANPDVLKSVGIQTAVRMLDYTLRNLNVYPDSKPKLDSIQTLCRERMKTKVLPPLRSAKQPTERVDAIKQIKDRSSMTVVSFASALKTKGMDRKEQKEALTLLRDMKSKYKRVHEKTVEQVATMAFGRNKERGGDESPPVL
ncbi:X-ray radiation resistance-associated protein 1 isoform X2 [Oryzias latipes]|uniref:X-ray radiation resistance-associated protein 1 isoform X2 n=1 Tax=Oryzias latipes TaxID=8090 RepID=UPI0005CBFB2A|nr:X-ray radiation resistance-associated protein 1 isoform X2 [Oryzias latipes]